MINNCVGDFALQGFDVEDFSHTVYLDGGSKIEPLDLFDDSNRQLLVDLSMEALDKYNTEQVYFFLSFSFFSKKN